MALFLSLYLELPVSGSIYLFPLNLTGGGGGGGLSIEIIKNMIHRFHNISESK